MERVGKIRKLVPWDFAVKKEERNGKSEPARRGVGRFAKGIKVGGKGGGDSKEAECKKHWGKGGSPSPFFGPQNMESVSP